MIEVDQIRGIGEYTTEERKANDHEKDTLYLAPNAKAFLVVRPKTIEVRCERKLSKLLQEKYETVMESRYFGRGGVEIVPAGQLESADLEDLIRLSYNLTVETEI